MHLAGLIGLSDHRMGLTAHFDSLEGTGLVIDFEMFRQVLAATPPCGDGAKGRRPPFGPVGMLKVLVLAAQSNVAMRGWSAASNSLADVAWFKWQTWVSSINSRKPRCKPMGA